jgi:hypothetical protein
MSDWWNSPSQTIMVWEEPPERTSTVLNIYGEPYVVRNTRRIGFHLPHRDKDNAREAKREKNLPLHKS